MKHCPFCASDIPMGATSCEACGKSFGKKKEEGESKSALTSLDAYQRPVSTWVVVIVVLFMLFGVALIFFR